MAKYKWSLATDFIANGRLNKVSEGDLIEFEGFSESGVGAGTWKATSTTGLSPSQAPADRGAAELVDGSGRLWELVFSDVVTIDAIGADSTGINDCSALCSAFLSSFYVLRFGYGTYSADLPITARALGHMKIEGVGQQSTILNWRGDLTAQNMWNFDNSALSSLYISDVSIKGSHDTNRSNIAAYPLLVKNCNVVNIRNVEVFYSRAMGIVVRGANSVDVGDCYVHHCARDGINTANCISSKIVKNRVEFVDDDAIANHNQVYIKGRSCVIEGNTVFMSQGIKCLGAQATTISSNSVDFFWAQGISVSTQAVDGVELEGVNAAISNSICGNTITNPIDRIALDGLNQGAPFVRVSGESSQAGVLSGVPGVKSDPSEYNYNIYSFSDNNSSTPISSSHNIVINGNTLGRDMPKTGNLSDLGLGMPWLRDGEYDIDLSANVSYTYQRAFEVIGCIKGVMISSNTVSSVRSFAFLSGDSDVSCVYFKSNICSDCDIGIVCPAGSLTYDATFEGNDFDLDPYFIDSDHNLDGTWSTAGARTFAFLQGNTGFKFIRNRFKNLSRLCDADVENSVNAGSLTWHENILHADPFAEGFNTSNKGCGEAPLIGFALEYAECAQSAANYGEVYRLPFSGKFSMPTAGKYIRGEFVKRIGVTLQGVGGNQYVNNGWIRLTTGSGHVAGTDWVESRSPTGT